MDEFISIGKILNFHGIKGEVKVGYTKGKERQIEGLKKVMITVNGENTFFNISSVRFHKQFALIKFKEVNSINDVEKIKGLDIKISKADAEKNLDEDEFLVSDLVGMDVLNKDGEKIGVISNIGSNGVSELLEITDANKKIHLVPFVKALVPVVNTEKNQIIVNDIEGLIE
ncbi:MAG: ribosome maturation factor RimM [Candidatus Gastranaerophilales bacterium]|nr:ribosome maturation factor RimM [Candidatus Gastranaerophilales bacterium]